MISGLVFVGWLFSSLFFVGLFNSKKSVVVVYSLAKYYSGILVGMSGAGSR